MMTTTPEEFEANFLNAAALAPPPGVTPNFADPPNLYNLSIAIFALCSCLGTLAVILRMGTKLFIIRQTAVEDCISSSPSWIKIQ